MWYAGGGPSTLQAFLLGISLQALFQYADYNLLITARNEVGARLCFYMCL